MPFGFMDVHQRLVQAPEMRIKKRRGEIVDRRPTDSETFSRHPQCAAQNGRDKGEVRILSGAILVLDNRSVHRIRVNTGESIQVYKVPAFFLTFTDGAVLNAFSNLLGASRKSPMLVVGSLMDENVPRKSVEVFDDDHRRARQQHFRPNAHRMSKTITKRRKLRLAYAVRQRKPFREYVFRIQ